VIKIGVYVWFITAKSHIQNDAGKQEHIVQLYIYVTKGNGNELITAIIGAWEKYSDAICHSMILPLRKYILLTHTTNAMCPVDNNLYHPDLMPKIE